jgi:hypothetical protein
LTVTHLLDSRREVVRSEDNTAESALPRSRGTLPSFPLCFCPHQCSDDWFLQSRHILRDQQQAKRQHPNSEDRKEAKNASYYEHYCNDKTYRKRSWLPQPSNKSRNAEGKSSISSFKVSVDFGFRPTHLRSLGFYTSKVTLGSAGRSYIAPPCR